MIDLFRFIALRAPERTTPDGQIDLTTDSPLQSELSRHRAATLSRYVASYATDPDHVPEPTLGRLRAMLTVASAPSDTNVQVRNLGNDMVATAKEFVAEFVKGALGPGFISDDATLPFQAAFASFAASAATASTRAELEHAVVVAFNQPAADVVADPDFVALSQHVNDTIVAVMIDPGIRSFPLADLARIARLIKLIKRVAAGDATLDKKGEIKRALDATLLLPPGIFPLRPGIPQPVGVGDLLVTKQQLKRYEPGDIANIENILHGEARKKVNLHALTTDTTVTTETSTTTEKTESLDLTERFDLKTESENVVKEDLSVSAGVSVSAKYGPVSMNANADVAYSLSKEQSTKAATDHAKDVTKRAATKVTEFVRRQEIARTIDKLVDRETHSFENTVAGAGNVSGVYQWINKVYDVQIFNYGKRLLFDFVIPEPAAFFRDALASAAQGPPIKPPVPFVVVIDNNGVRPVTSDDLGTDGLLKAGVKSRPIEPADLSEDPNSTHHYSKFVGLYAALGVDAPPEPYITVSKALTGNKDDHDHLAAADTLEIPMGYQATSVDVRGGFTLYEDEDGDESLWVFVGRNRYECSGQGNLPDRAAFLPSFSTVIDEQGMIPIAVETQQARDYAIGVDVRCERTPAALEQWQLQAFSALVNVYADQMKAYNDAVAAQQMQKKLAPDLGSNPDLNQLIERAELKKHCIAKLSGTDLYAAQIDDVRVETGGSGAFPRPNVPPKPNAGVIGGDQEAFIAFFEQAFEWEHMMYIFYPYFWARRETWYQEVLENDPDPLFSEFLKAGAARVVVPVRLQLEGDVRYFCMTGQIWRGGEMPGITDSDYLPITEEIKARDDAPGNEVPEGDPWEVSLPTSLIRLRADDALPLFKKYRYHGQDVWVPGSKENGDFVPDFGAVDGGGAWSPG